MDRQPRPRPLALKSDPPVPLEATRLDPDVYRAPSFSWASMDTQIQFEARDEDETEDDAAILIDVVEAKAMVAGLNPLGEVGDGWIVLCAPVVEGTLVALKQGTALKLRVGGSEGFVGVCPDSLLVETDVSFGDRGARCRVERCGGQGKERRTLRSRRRLSAWL